MYFILHPDSLVHYLKNRNSLKKSIIERKFYSIVESNEIKWFCSDSLYSMYEKNIPDGEKDIFNNLMKELIDNNPDKLLKVPTKKTNSIESEIIEIYNQSSGTVLCFSNNLNKILNQNIGDDYYSLQSPPKSISSKSNILIELLSNSTYSVDHTSFNSDTEIEKLFQSFIDLSKKCPNKTVFLFSRDFNMSACIFKELFHKNSLNIEYYSRRFKQSGSSTVLTSDELKKNFKSLKSDLKCSIKLHLTTNPNYIHERKIIMNEYALICDDDFNNISKKRETWSITIKYCPNKHSKYLQKTDKFNEFILR